MTSEHHDVIVIGAGQAGLAIGHHLAQQNRRFTILDAASAPAAAWRSRWDSLRLFTPARYDNLPGLPFPGDPDHYPTRDEVVGYLTDYARHFALPVELDSRVTAVHTEDGGYRVELADRALHAQQVVIATGPFQVPRVPALASQLTSEVVQLHSADYRMPGDLPAGRVLVVGGGNTGYQIAEELAALTRRAPGHRLAPDAAAPADPRPRPVRLPHRDRPDERHRELAHRQRLKDREALIGSSPRAARRSGITIHPRATHADGSTVAFADGSRLDVDAVLWATGFDRDHEWIHAPVFDHRGVLLHERGVTPSPGLYFLGMPWQHTRGSALLGWVKHDARHIAEHISALTPRRRVLA